jgi:ribulose-phosphate 3-epimerase
MVLVAPSILSADFSKLGEEIKAVEHAGADWIHIDVMDGHFVPNITIGPVVVSKIRKISDIFFDVHLMIENPGKYVEQFAKAGADLITIHAETCDDILSTINKVKDLGCKVGVSINPETSLECDDILSTINKVKDLGCKVGVSINPETSLDVIKEIIQNVDLVLIMSVHPGFGGQSFIEDVLPKIKKTRDIISKMDKEIHLEVDGGINDKTAKTAIEYGANVLVAGNFVFTNASYRDAIKSLKQL